MKLKGIVLAVILLLASIMMPFDVYAAGQSQIVPTFSSSTSQWNGHLYVTNFSDGTNNQASSTLSFSFDDDYYGIIYFDGYGPSNQHIANYAACFVAGGYGEYRYSYYQNAVINITSVTINIVSVVKPQTTVDLTQIITLLTAIENDTSSIDNVLDTTLAQIRLVLNELIESNGYLETLTKMRQWNIPMESIGAVSYLFVQNYELLTYDNNVFGYPMFIVPSNGVIHSSWISTGANAFLIFGTDVDIWNKTKLLEYFNINNPDLVISVTQYRTIYFKSDVTYFIKIGISNNSNSKGFTISPKETRKIMPIYFGFANDNKISTDFALLWGFSNNLLNNLNIIANGTSQSSSSASDLESSNNQMADDMDDLATIENGYNQQFNNQLQQIDFSSPLQNNAGILPAANFVITIFNGLINNNPFSVLIIVVCILLIGKKVIGK